DFTGYGGQGPGSSSGGPFSSATQLRLGIDYILVPDGISHPDTGLTLGESGLLERLRSSFFGGGGFFPEDYGSARASRRPLTAPSLPVWPQYDARAIKVSFAAGYGVGAPPGGNLPVGTTLPTELTLAVCALAAAIRMVKPLGLPIDESNATEQFLTCLSH